MAIAHGKVALNASTPTQLTPAGREPGLGLTIQIQNVSAVDVFIGGDGLTSSSYGCKIAPGASCSIESLSPADEIYGLSSTGSADVAVLMVRR